MRVHRVVIGLVAGLIVGSAIGSSASPVALRVVGVIEPIGQLWLNAIRMTVLPLVVSMLFVGVASAKQRRWNGPGSDRDVGRVFRAAPLRGGVRAADRAAADKGHAPLAGRRGQSPCLGRRGGGADGNEGEPTAGIHRVADVTRSDKRDEVSRRRRDAAADRLHAALCFGRAANRRAASPVACRRLQRDRRRDASDRRLGDDRRCADRRVRAVSWRRRVAWVRR